MPILMTAEVHGQTEQGYHEVFSGVAAIYAVTPGFVAHMSHPIDGGWCVMDIWSSREQFQAFFREHVAHRLPSTVRPRISFQELHDLLTPAPAAALPAAAE